MRAGVHHCRQFLFLPAHRELDSHAGFSRAVPVKFFPEDEEGEQLQSFDVGAVIERQRPTAGAMAANMRLRAAICRKTSWSRTINQASDMDIGRAVKNCHNR